MCGSPSCGCSSNRCTYSRYYAEQSSSQGWVIQDKLAFPDGAAHVDFVFGCETKETGEIYRQTVDGILGLGNNDNSLPSQLYYAGVIDNVFSTCYGYPKGGALLLGAPALPPSVHLSYTPMQITSHHYFNVVLRGISVAGNALPAGVMSGFSTGYRTVLDSGTTFTFFPTAAYSAFVDAVKKQLATSSLPQVDGEAGFHDVCWDKAPTDASQLAAIFPEVVLTFDADINLVLTPMQYLFMLSEGKWCLGVFNNGPNGALIGGITVRNTLVQYDKRNKRVGFAPVSSCDTLLHWNATAGGNATADVPKNSRVAPKGPQANSAGSGTGAGNKDADRGGFDTPGHAVLKAALVLFLVGVVLQAAYVKREWLAAQAAVVYRFILRRPMNAEEQELVRLTEGMPGSEGSAAAAAGPAVSLKQPKAAAGEV